MPLPTAWGPLVGADIYLIDQLLRGRIREGMTLLDVGCGSGRNLAALVAAGCGITGVDADPRAVDEARALLAGRVDPGRIIACDIEAMPFTPGSFDAVLVNAVLHFAPDADAFMRWADACWRQLAPRGLFLARLSTRIALPDARPRGFRYLATADNLAACERRWRAIRVDPLKTTLVDTVRTMTTWVLTRG